MPLLFCVEQAGQWATGPTRVKMAGCVNAGSESQLTGALAKLREVTVSFDMSVSHSVCLTGILSFLLSVWNNSIATGRRILMKFGIRGSFENLSRKLGR
jgi:hypothetical protein